MEQFWLALTKSFGEHGSGILSDPDLLYQEMLDYMGAAAGSEMEILRYYCERGFLTKLGSACGSQAKEQQSAVLGEMKTGAVISRTCSEAEADSFLRNFLNVLTRTSRQSIPQKKQTAYPAEQQIFAVESAAAEHIIIEPPVTEPVPVEPVGADPVDAEPEDEDPVDTKPPAADPPSDEPGKAAKFFDSLKDFFLMYGKGIAAGLLFAAVALGLVLLITNGFGKKWWSFNEKTGELKICCKGDMEDYFDASGQPWKKDRINIRTITVEEGVTHIGDFAFAFCEAAESVRIPESVESIGSSAFANSGLKQLVVPVGVTSIEEYSFSGCRKLERVSLPYTLIGLGQYSFEDCKQLRNVEFDDVALPPVLTRGVFSNCSSLESITIPIYVSEIEEDAFCNCSKLRDISVAGMAYWNDYFIKIGNGNECFTENVMRTGKAEGHFGDVEAVDFGYGNAFYLDSAKIDFRAVAMELTIYEDTGDFPFGSWSLFAKTGQGEWERIASYGIYEDQIGKDVMHFLTFEEPKSFDALAICPDMDVAFTYSFSVQFYF